MEKEFETAKNELENERKMKAELDRIRRRVEGEVDDLNQRLENEIKNGQKLQKEKKKLVRDLKDAKARLGEEETTRADQETSVWKLEEELDEYRNKYEAELKAKTLLEKAKKSSRCSN